jgi:hypothetical protein
MTGHMAQGIIAPGSVSSKLLCTASLYIIPDDLEHLRKSYGPRLIFHQEPDSYKMKLVHNDSKEHIELMN